VEISASYFSESFITSAAFLFPFSAIFFIRIRLKVESAVSVAEKYADMIIQKSIIKILIVIVLCLSIYVGFFAKLWGQLKKTQKRPNRNEVRLSPVYHIYRAFIRGIPVRAVVHDMLLKIIAHWHNALNILS
jgi:hypothetical protein